MDSSIQRVRRRFIALASASLLLREQTLLGKPVDYPAQVAGIRLPRTSLCGAAYDLCRAAAPAFLLNHSLRTYVFGALHLAHQRLGFNAETAFTAALLHDLGLLAQFASRTGSFEIDGADRAERLVRDHGATAAEARAVWNAIVMHDMRYAISAHQSPEATVLAAGAGADVVGPDRDEVDAVVLKEVVAAFPRLQFKSRFIDLLAEHCRRKPGAQNGTWLEGFCRLHSAVPDSATEQAIRTAPFDE
jgi:hypothetical protein